MCGPELCCYKKAQEEEKDIKQESSALFGKAVPPFLHVGDFPMKERTPASGQSLRAGPGLYPAGTEAFLPPPPLLPNVSFLKKFRETFT